MVYQLFLDVNKPSFISHRNLVFLSKTLRKGLSDMKMLLCKMTHGIMQQVGASIF